MNIIDLIKEHWELILGIVLAIVSLGLIIKSLYDRKTGFRCKGVIVGFSKGERDVQFPIFLFTYEGEEYRISSLNGSKKPKKGIGAETEIIYKPKNQKYVIEVGDYKDIWICLACLAVGVVFALTAVF